jgi:hypothetical protein
MHASVSLRLCLAACVFLGPAACATVAPPSAPGSGRVTVGVTSSGPDVRAMTFKVSIEPAGIGGPISADAGIFTAPDTPAGDHVVRLTGLPGRCRLDGDSERKISVSARRSATVRFVVVCR